MRATARSSCANIVMCGIAAELRFDANLSDSSIPNAMCDIQTHKGPDDEDYYVSGRRDAIQEDPRATWICLDLSQVFSLC